MSVFLSTKGNATVHDRIPRIRLDDFDTAHTGRHHCTMGHLGTGHCRDRARRLPLLCRRHMPHCHETRSETSRITIRKAQYPSIWIGGREGVMVRRCVYAADVWCGTRTHDLHIYILGRHYWVLRLRLSKSMAHSIGHHFAAAFVRGPKFELFERICLRKWTSHRSVPSDCLSFVYYCRLLWCMHIRVIWSFILF